MPTVSPLDGPVVVTGASGFVGSHVALALVERGYEVRACVTDLTNTDRTAHLEAMNTGGAGKLTLHQGNLLEEGSYDAVCAGARAILHVGTAMAYAAANDPREVYDGAVAGTRNLLGSVRRAGSVRRFVYTSSFSAIGHPAEPGYEFSEQDWACDNQPPGVWDPARVDQDGEIAYAMAKVDTERLVNRAAEQDGRFDAISVCPMIVLGPLLSRVHELVFSWQWFLGRMLRGKPCQRRWEALWNIVDVRDVGTAQALILENEICQNGSRYQLCASDESGELDVYQLQAHLQRLFPEIVVGGAPPEMAAYLEKHGELYDGPRAYCKQARKELGLETHSIEDTLRSTGESLIELGLIEPAFRARSSGL